MKISIVTPSYNQDQFIERTILSVVTQKGDFDLEYIIVDGLSTDQSLAIIKKYDEKIKSGVFDGHTRSLSFRWLSEKDEGQSDAINKGLKLTTGDLVTYLNSDDTYELGALQLIVDTFAKTDKKWCYGKCKIIDFQDQEIRRYITIYKNILSKNFSFSKLLSENFICQMTVFWKRELLDEIGFFDKNQHLCMDYEYWLRISSRYAPVYIPQYIANFRFYQTSKSGSRFHKQFQQELEVAHTYARGKYKLSLLLHKFNYYKIVIIYKILSFIKK